MANYSEFARSEASRTDRSTGQLLTDLMRQISRLLRQEVALARAEVSETTSHIGAGVTLIGAGFLFLMSGMVALLGAAVAGLSLVWPLWLSALVVGGGVFLIGLILALVGKNQLAARNLLPVRTARTLREDAEFVRDELVKGRMQ
jgi:hypothetical protein